MPTLYLHIGTPKTGTTAIQRFCRNNKRALAEMGCCYPIFPRKYPSVRLARNGHFLYEYGQAARQSGARAAEEIWRHHMGYVTQLLRKYPSVVLSEEFLWLLTGPEYAALWERLRRESEAHGFEVRIVAYLRRQDQLLLSWWAQMVKRVSPTDSTIPWSDAVRQPEALIPLDYCGALDRIAGIFGRESILVRVYDRARFPGENAALDFLDAIGLRQGGGFRVPGGDSNLSVSPNLLDVLREISALPGLHGSTKNLARTAAVNCSPAGPERCSMFSEAELREFLRRYEDSNRRLAERYLGGAGPLFDALPEELPPKWNPDDAEMRATLTQYLKEILCLHSGRARAKASKRTQLSESAHKLSTTFRLLADYLLLR